MSPIVNAFNEVEVFASFNADKTNDRTYLNQVIYNLKRIIVVKI